MRTYFKTLLGSFKIGANSALKSLYEIPRLLRAIVWAHLLAFLGNLLGPYSVLRLMHKLHQRMCTLKPRLLRNIMCTHFVGLFRSSVRS